MGFYPALPKAFGQARERRMVSAFTHRSSSTRCPRTAKRSSRNVRGCGTVNFHFV
jgi:hypothetical protein